MVLFMALYPLRHIHIGIDLWDVGYNYANFEYMGLDSMDSMWFFSTYLATGLGHLLSLLPFGKTLLGMNFYTSLVVSLCSITAYMFFTRTLKLPKILVFAGEYVAISLCWCPTALLYNYMTYYFLMLAAICLYYGLWHKRAHCLFAAGLCLGLNVFVRFSNLPEVVLIFAVWVYGILETEEKIKAETEIVKKRERKSGFKRTAQRTILCVLGYISVVGGMLLFFGLKYGFRAYFDAITRLLGMTGEASDYTAKSMLVGLVKWYLEGSYWLSRLAVFAVGGILVCAFAKYLDIQNGIRENDGKGLFGKKFTFLGLAYIISSIFALCSIGWLYYKKFSFNAYGEYGSILLPCMVVILIAVIVCLIQIFKPGTALNFRLLSGLILIIILITPIGSNTGIFPVISNMFMIAPYLIYCVWRLLIIKDGEGISRYNYYNPLIVRETNKRRKLYEIVWSYVSLFPIKAGLIAYGILCLVQITTFGKEFVFTEGHNAWDTYYIVSSDKTMNGIRMDYLKASTYSDLYRYINDEGLQDNELITFGNIPALAFYLQMPPAFNAWVDLDSYNEAILAQNLDLTREEAEAAMAKSLSEAEAKLQSVIMDNNIQEDSPEAEEIMNSVLSPTNAYPVVIVDAKYVAYMDPIQTEKLAADETIDESKRKEAEAVMKNGKWTLMINYFEQAGYEITYVNYKYAVLTVPTE
ncbi:MAG: hypothetical protein MJ130_09710 [Lachnospiraceae bacterium]|nr:hypothetical protein [Lachnospiraceae bacterium]